MSRFVLFNGGMYPIAILELPKVLYHQEDVREGSLRVRVPVPEPLDTRSVMSGTFLDEGQMPSLHTTEVDIRLAVLARHERGYAVKTPILHALSDQPYRWYLSDRDERMQNLFERALSVVLNEHFRQTRSWRELKDV